MGCLVVNPCSIQGHPHYKKGAKTMPRKNQVTRTMKTTRCSVLCLDVLTAEPQNVEVTVPRTYPDEKSLMKVIRPMLETESLKPVKVVETEVVETLYAMDEDYFLAHAKPVEPRKTANDEA